MHRPVSWGALAIVLLFSCDGGRLAFGDIIEPFHQPILETLSTELVAPVVYPIGTPSSGLFVAVSAAEAVAIQMVDTAAGNPLLKRSVSVPLGDSSDGFGAALPWVEDSILVATRSDLLLLKVTASSTKVTLQGAGGFSLGSPVATELFAIKSNSIGDVDGPNQKDPPRIAVFCTAAGQIVRVSHIDGANPGPSGPLSAQLLLQVDESYTTFYNYLGYIACDGTFSYYSEAGAPGRLSPATICIALQGTTMYVFDGRTGNTTVVTNVTDEPLGDTLQVSFAPECGTFAFSDQATVYAFSYAPKAKSGAVTYAIRPLFRYDVSSSNAPSIEDLTVVCGPAQGNVTLPTVFASVTSEVLTTSYGETRTEKRALLALAPQGSNSSVPPTVVKARGNVIGRVGGLRLFVSGNGTAASVPMFLKVGGNYVLASTNAVLAEGRVTALSEVELMEDFVTFAASTAAWVDRPVPGLPVPVLCAALGSFQGNSVALLPLTGPSSVAPMVLPMNLQSQPGFVTVGGELYSLAAEFQAGTLVVAPANEPPMITTQTFTWSFLSIATAPVGPLGDQLAVLSTDERAARGVTGCPAGSHWLAWVDGTSFSAPLLCLPLDAGFNQSCTSMVLQYAPAAGLAAVGCEFQVTASAASSSEPSFIDGSVMAVVTVAKTSASVVFQKTSSCAHIQVLLQNSGATFVHSACPFGQFVGHVTPLGALDFSWNIFATAAPRIVGQSAGNALVTTSNVLFVVGNSTWGTPKDIDSDWFARQFLLLPDGTVAVCMVKARSSGIAIFNRTARKFFASFETDCEFPLLYSARQGGYLYTVSSDVPLVSVPSVSAYFVRINLRNASDVAAVPMSRYVLGLGLDDENQVALLTVQGLVSTETVAIDLVRGVPLWNSTGTVFPASAPGQLSGAGAACGGWIWLLQDIAGAVEGVSVYDGALRWENTFPYSSSIQLVPSNEGGSYGAAVQVVEESAMQTFTGQAIGLRRSYPPRGFRSATDPLFSSSLYPSPWGTDSQTAAPGSGSGEDDTTAVTPGEVVGIIGGVIGTLGVMFVAITMYQRRLRARVAENGLLMGDEGVTHTAYVDVPVLGSIVTGDTDPVLGQAISPRPPQDSDPDE